ncbi:MAG: FliM/FliN family flagellar motor C-terminal domain-containing protein [Phycisphaerales bacterium]
MPADIKAILQLEVPLIVQIAMRTMTVEEVTSLVPGAIIELPKPAADELELVVSNKPIGTGTAVKVGENYGLRVTYIGDLQDRIAAMATNQTETEIME